MTSNELKQLGGLKKLIDEFGYNNIDRLAFIDCAIEHLICLIGYDEQTVSEIRTDKNYCGCFYNQLNNYFQSELKEYNTVISE